MVVDRVVIKFQFSFVYLHHMKLKSLIYSFKLKNNIYAISCKCFEDLKELKKLSSRNLRFCLIYKIILTLMSN